MWGVCCGSVYRGAVRYAFGSGFYQVSSCVVLEVWEEGGKVYRGVALPTKKQLFILIKQQQFKQAAV